MNLEALILVEITHTDQPLKAAQIVKRVKAQAGRAATPKAVAAVLETLAASGRVTCICAGNATRWFTTHSFEIVAAALLRPLIQKAKKPLLATKLRTKLPAALQPHFAAALNALVTQGDAFVPAGEVRLIYARRPKPSELLSAAQQRALQKIFDGINAFRSRSATLTDFVAWLDEETSGLRAETSSARVTESLAQPDEALLHEWYELDRRHSSTVMVPIQHTFARYLAWATAQDSRADSQILRNVLSALYNEGRILLEPCERPQDLPEHERELLVPMSLGPPGRCWCWSA